MQILSTTLNRPLEPNSKLAIQIMESMQKVNQHFCLSKIILHRSVQLQVLQGCNGHIVHRLWKFYCNCFMRFGIEGETVVIAKYVAGGVLFVIFILVWLRWVNGEQAAFWWNKNQ